MLRQSRASGPLFIFYLLVAYIFLQFTWWTYAMFQHNNEIAGLRHELNILKATDPQAAYDKGQEIAKHLHSRWAMVAGEAAVFCGILMLGILRIRTTFRKEKELAERQKNFLLSVTHELKSPLASTKLQLQTIERHTLPREQELQIVKSALNDVDRLNNLVENILLAARIENRLEIHREKYNLSAYITEGMEQTIRSFNYPQKIRLDIEPGIMMKIDRTNFPSIILNLIDNAVKYSPKDSEITLSLRSKGQKVVLAVADQGAGIPDDDKKNIFEKFYRVGNEETRRSKGTGLGLYITRFLVEQHMGTIIVKDNHPAGSIFEITFNISNEKSSADNS